MPKISEDIIRAVTDAARIEDVVGDFVTLRRAGVNLTGICPFHDDKHDGNFIVRPSTISEKNHGNTYRCFVCDAKGGPVQFLMNAEHMTFPDAIRYIGKKYSIDVDNVPLNWTPPPTRPIPPPPPPLKMRREWVKQLMDCDYNRNIFTYWYGKLPWNQEQRKMMARTLWEYCVGCYHDGRVVFWQIDHNGIPRAAKLMKYLTDGHRDKTVHPGWIYNQDGYRQECRPDEHTVLHPLFGAHLLRRYPDAAVNIVESEKTALIMANYYGIPDRQLWLACGGLKHLQIESMQPLIDQGRKVWLWPDKDGIDKWQEVTDKLGSEHVKVYTRFFDACWVPEDGNKADIADITIRIMRDPDFKPRKVEEKSGGEVKGTPKGESVGASPAVLVQYDEPFIDPEELDPKVHKWREVFRRRYNFNKTKNLMPTTSIEGVKSVGEILQENPLIKKLLE